MEHLRDLLRSGAAQPAQQQEMALDAMPAAWAAHIHGPSPQPTHLASADPADRRIFCPGPDGHLTHTYTASSTAALLAVEQLPQPTLGQDLPAGLRPVLVIQWDPTRPWHPRHSAGQHQVPALGPHLVGAWSEGTVDPRSWCFSSVPAHEYVVRDSASRLRALRRILAGQQDAISPIRPTIWASAYGDEHSGVRGRNRSSDRYGAGAPACLRRQACSCPSQSDVLSHAWCQACVELCLLGREGSM